MKILENYFELPKPIRNFIDSYNSSINYFNEAIIYYKQQPSKHLTPIKNADLWIEAHINLFPQKMCQRKNG